MKRRLAAFTLVELLVVVTIFALLISILAPSLGRARQAGRQVQCVANLKGLSSASFVYAAEDLGENVVPVHALTRPGLRWTPDDILASGHTEWGGKSGAGKPLEDVTDPLTSYWGTAQGRGPTSRPLNRVVYKAALKDYRESPGDDQRNWWGDTRLNLDLYRCPNDSGHTAQHLQFWEDSGLSGYDFFGNSYTVPWLDAPWGSGRFRAVGIFEHSSSSIPNPGNTLHYIEACAHNVPIALCTWQGDCNDHPDIWPYGKVETNEGWHGRPWRFSTAYADGHASVTLLNEMYVPPPQLSRYPKKHPHLEYGYEDWFVYIIRGPGWQLDTLPAAPVPRYDYTKAQ